MSVGNDPEQEHSKLKRVIIRERMLFHDRMPNIVAEWATKSTLILTRPQAVVFLLTQPSAAVEKINCSEKQETLGPNRRGNDWDRREEKKYHVEEGN